MGDGHAPGGALAFPEADASPQLEILVVEVVRGAERELLGRLVVLVDRPAIGARELSGAGDDGRQHRVEIERRADGPADVAEGGELPHRARQLGCARLQLAQEAGILDGDDGLVGEGLNQLDLGVGERAGRMAGEHDHPDRLTTAEDGHRELAAETEPLGDARQAGGAAGSSRSGTCTTLASTTARPTRLVVSAARG